ncbi:MAG: hypothetical protein K2W33_03745 [Burkholderiales bacterium]|nr:hypothetical protein [Burkholderiales bacterium]
MTFVEEVDGRLVAHDPLIVMSPVCFLPVVIAYARSLAKQVLGPGGEAVLEFSTQTRPESVFGLSQNLSSLDASVAGTLRTLLLSRGFDLLCQEHAHPPGVLPLEKLETYFSSAEGQRYLQGHADINLDLPIEVSQEVLNQALTQ